MFFQNVDNQFSSVHTDYKTNHQYSYFGYNFRDNISDEDGNKSDLDNYSRSEKNFATGVYNSCGNYEDNSNHAVKDRLARQWAVTKEPDIEEYNTKEEYCEALEAYHDYVKDRIENGPEKFQIGAMEMSLEEWEKLLEKVDTQIEDIKESIKQDIERLKEARERLDMQEDEELKELQIKSLFTKRLNGDFGAPYSYLADESGIISYKGAVFVCDNEKKQLCLGDMSNPNDVLNIPLSKGGCLRVNRDNLGELAKAISMFSPEDINLIMRAIAQDTKVQQMKNEIEEEKSNPLGNL